MNTNLAGWGQWRAFAAGVCFAQCAASSGFVALWALGFDFRMRRELQQQRARPSVFAPSRPPPDTPNRPSHPLGSAAVCSDRRGFGRPSETRVARRIFAQKRCRALGGSRPPNHGAGPWECCENQMFSVSADIRCSCLALGRGLPESTTTCQVRCVVSRGRRRGRASGPAVVRFPGRAHHSGTAGG